MEVCLKSAFFTCRLRLVSHVRWRYNCRYLQSKCNCAFLVRRSGRSLSYMPEYSIVSDERCRMQPDFSKEGAGPPTQTGSAAYVYRCEPLFSLPLRHLPRDRIRFPQIEFVLVPANATGRTHDLLREAPFRNKVVNVGAAERSLVQDLFEIDQACHG